MTLQKETTDRKTKAVIDNCENTRPIEVHFNTFWSSSLYPCQTTNSHVVMFIKVPTFSNNIDTQMFWIVATLIVRVEPFGRSFVKYHCIHPNDMVGCLPMYQKIVSIMVNDAKKDMIHSSLYTSTKLNVYWRRYQSLMK